MGHFNLAHTFLFVLSFLLLSESALFCFLLFESYHSKLILDQTCTSLLLTDLIKQHPLDKMTSRLCLR